MDKFLRFFSIRFPVKYSDRLGATAALKVLDFQFLMVLKSVRLSLRLCKILVQFMIFRLFFDTLNSFYITHGSGVCFLTLFKLIKNLDPQS